MSGTVALIASLDTKEEETRFAAEEIRRCGCDVLLMDISTRTPEDRGAQICAPAILAELGMTWAEFALLNKADRIDTMAEALSVAVPTFYRKGLFDAIVSIGGGQNARMAAAGMKPLPFGVPKIIASSLACGKRTMEQYVGGSDIFVLHTVADISMLNYATRTVILNACHSVVGMLQLKKELPPDQRKKLAASMLGITTAGVEGALDLLPNEEYEKTVFHANGVGGRCMEQLIRAGHFDLVLDATLHEVTCELLGGYCTGANGRLLSAADMGIPMVVVPGAADILDYFVDENGGDLPPDIGERRYVLHNASVCHARLKAGEIPLVTSTIAERLNRAASSVIIVLPEGGLSEAAAPGGPLYDPESDRLFADSLLQKLSRRIRVIHVPGNINTPACQKAIAEAVLSLTAEPSDIRKHPA